MELIQPYVGIAVKLIVGMIGILTFLRITGKAQMGQWCIVQSRYDHLASRLRPSRMDRL